MVRYAVRRLVTLLPLLLAVSLAAFYLYSQAPGDPAYLYLPPHASQEDLDRVRRTLGLDQPWYVQYRMWLGNVLRGDFGRSLYDRQPVLEKFAAALPVTLGISALSLCLSLAAATALGVAAAARRGSVADYAVRVFAYLGQAIPGFWLGLLLILVFTVKLGWLPSVGLHTPRRPPDAWDTALHLIMPLIVISWESIAGTARFIRSGLLEVLGEDYIRTARPRAWETGSCSTGTPCAPRCCP